MKQQNIAAVILAGGKNTRLNYEKSLLQIENHYFIQHQVEILREIFDEIIIVTEKEDLLKMLQHVRFAKDNFSNCGPIGGIEAAMKKYSFANYFIFACDMPFLDKDIITKMILSHHNKNCEITIPQHRDGIEPLHAIYNRKVLGILQQSIKYGHYQVRNIFQNVKVNYQYFNAKEIKFFFNINTPKDLKIFSKMTNIEEISVTSKISYAYPKKTENA